jgi:pachytene checkpoint protein 2
MRLPTGQAAGAATRPLLPVGHNGLDPAGEPIKGIAAAHALPHAPFSQLWEAILLDGDQKDRLLAQAVLSFTLRPRVEPGSVPLHGLILLVGPPGTGKTSLARGLASRTAEAFGERAGFQYLEVESHALANAGLGRSQQAVRKLLNEVIAERAELGPLIVLLDEVETLAADRAKLSLEANPVDVHRATDAVLAGLDQLAAAYPRLLFVATSNFAGAIDAALLSRADLVEAIPLPGPETARAILKDAVEALAKAYPSAARVLDDRDFARAAAACQGLDGRQIRKLVVAACTFDKQTALDPGRLTAADLVRAAERARRDPAASVTGGVR